MDIQSPQSSINGQSQRQGTLSFSVSVTGSDPAPTGTGLPVSGVQSYDLYVATDGIHFTDWITVPAGNPTAIYTGVSNTTYSFYSIARDNAGNIENSSPTTEACTYVPELDAPVTQVTELEINAATFAITVTGADIGGSGLASFVLYVEVDSGDTAASGTGVSRHARLERQLFWHGTLSGNLRRYRAHVPVLRVWASIKPATSSRHLRIRIKTF